MTHVEDCRPLHYFVAAYSESLRISWTRAGAERLLKVLESDGFRALAYDDTGLSVSADLTRDRLPKELEKLNYMRVEGFIPASLDISISGNGVILISLFCWYAFYDIPPGEDGDIRACEHVIQYLQRIIRSTGHFGKNVRISIIKGIRRCLFEHPGAYKQPSG